MMKFLNYIEGVRRGKTAHQIEHEAMSDSFLSEAIDGYDSVAGNHVERIARMQALVLARTTSVNLGTKQKTWKVAAAAIFIIALLSGYFALMNHQSSMTVAQESENLDIPLYAPENYIKQRIMELTVIAENHPLQKVSVESVVPISNLKDVIKPAEVFPLYVPESYTDAKKEELEGYNSNTNQKKIYITDAVSSILEEAKISRPLPILENMDNVWSTREVREVTRSQIIETTKESAKGNNRRVVETYSVLKEPKEFASKNTEATSTVKLDVHEALAFAKAAGFDDIEIVGADELDGNILELTESEKTTKIVRRESFYRSKKDASSDSQSSGTAENSHPVPLIGYKEYKKYLKKNAIHPKDGECDKTKGKVIVRLKVDKSGNPIDVFVKKGLCKELDKEAVRLVKNGPKWKYGALYTDVEVEF